MECEKVVKIIIGFVNGREKTLIIDKHSLDEDNGYLEIYKDGKSIGMISPNQISYWYVED